MGKGVGKGGLEGRGIVDGGRKGRGYKGMEGRKGHAPSGGSGLSPSFKGDGRP